MLRPVGIFQRIKLFIFINSIINICVDFSVHKRYGFQNSPFFINYHYPFRAFVLAIIFRTMAIFDGVKALLGQLWVSFCISFMNVCSMII